MRRDTVASLVRWGIAITLLLGVSAWRRGFDPAVTGILAVGLGLPAFAIVGRLRGLRGHALRSAAVRFVALAMSLGAASQWISRPAPDLVRALLMGAVIFAFVMIQDWARHEPSSQA